MSQNPSRYYVAELEERLGTLAAIDNDEFMTRGMVLQIGVATLVVPVLALLIGWFTL